MQFLWFFIETIADKSISFFIVLELIGYRSVHLFLVALPLACLIASVMTVGVLAERYELSSFHSAGVSPDRILRPLLLCGTLVAALSYLTADYIVPASNLAFYERLQEVQLNDAALHLEAGVFNDDLPGFTIMAKKKADNGNLEDILLYDHRYSTGSGTNIISGKSGSLTVDKAEESAGLLLRNGSNYRERTTASKTFVRTNFESYQKRFLIADFSSPDLAGNSSHYSLLTSWQLQAAADSVKTVMDSLSNDFSRRVAFSGSKPASGTGIHAVDSTLAYQQARNRARRIRTEAASLTQRLARERETSVRYLYRKHEKYSLAAVCILFVLVGGGLGEIVRSGNFGFPVLVSISVFVAYIMGSIFCRRLAESFVLHPLGAGWVPAMVILILGTGLRWWRSG
jgi:lipopolysaccharide export system permease protein